MLLYVILFFMFSSPGRFDSTTAVVKYFKMNSRAMTNNQNITAAHQQYQKCLLFISQIIILQPTRAWYYYGLF